MKAFNWGPAHSFRGPVCCPHGGEDGSMQAGKAVRSSGELTSGPQAGDGGWGSGMGFQWYTSSNKNPQKTVPSTWNQTFKYMSLWEPFLFKAPCLYSTFQVKTCSLDNVCSFFLNKPSVSNVFLASSSYTSWYLLCCLPLPEMGHQRIKNTHTLPHVHVCPMHSTLLIVGPSLSLPTKENEIRMNVDYLYMQIYLLRLLITYLYGKLGSDFAGVLSPLLTCGCRELPSSYFGASRMHLACWLQQHMHWNCNDTEKNACSHLQWSKIRISPAPGPLPRDNPLLGLHPLPPTLCSYFQCSNLNASGGVWYSIGDGKPLNN